MASFYDSASIITIPSGYKAGTLYSAKPTDGSGDMTFTRTGDTATRVNSAGLIERCITNVLLQSNNFPSASWAKSNVNVGTGITDPEGGTTAFSLAGSSATSNIKSLTQGAFPVGTDIKTVSVYAKANTHNFLQVRLGNTGTYVNFDLSTGTLSNGSGASGTMTNIGGGWYRCVCATTINASSINSIIGLIDSLSAIGGDNSTTTNSIYIWRAQAQFGDQATNYIDTTTAAVTEGPVTNLPRLDYFGSTCPQLLMEPTRTNLMTYSQMLDNSAWSKDGVSVSGNVAVSPDGYTNAEVVVEDTSTTAHRNSRIVAWVSGTTYSISFFVKQGSGSRRFAISLAAGSFGAGLVCNYNIQTGLVTTNSASITGKIENYGNGWYRCIATATATITASSNLVYYLRQNDIASTATYLGDGTSSLFVWGAQVEAGAYATSYIPTTAATVTRNQDIASKTSITSLIGQSEGTFFVDFDRTTSSVTSSDIFAISLSNGGSQNRILIQYQPHNLSYIGAVIRINSVTLYDGNFNNSNSRIKIAIGYKLNDLAVYINGVQVGTNALSSDFSINNLTKFSTDSGAGNNIFVSRTNQALVFKTRLTNAELATLTTL